MEFLRKSQEYWRGYLYVYIYTSMCLHSMWGVQLRKPELEGIGHVGMVTVYGRRAYVRSIVGLCMGDQESCVVR